MEALDDDIFARPPRSARRKGQMPARITCRVCGAPAVVPPDHPALLCGHCLEDLDKTRRHVAECVAAALARLDATGEAWRAAVEGSPAKGRWSKVQDAMIGVAEKRVDKATFEAQWAKRRAEGGDLAALLLAYEAHADECDQIAEELERLHLAQNEINAAWLNTNGEAFKSPDVHPIEVRWSGPKCYATNGPNFTKWHDTEAEALQEAATWI